MKSWQEFSAEDPQLARIGKDLLLRSRPGVGFAFLATLRKDGAPRLHPVALVFYQDRLYVLIPSTSPKCADLLRDGRYAMQAFPPAQDETNQEFYLAGFAKQIEDPQVRRELIQGTNIHVEANEVLFEMLLERAMHTHLAELGTPGEHPVHQKWQAD